MADLLRLLLQVAEKAANVARMCRQEAPLLQLLVQEKTEKHNKKDFKTFVDVVIQEMISHDVGAQFPEMIGFIHGEESNTFENGRGETVTVTIGETEEETAALLATVLDGDKTAASLLAQAIHQDPATISHKPPEEPDVPEVLDVPLPEVIDVSDVSEVFEMLEDVYAPEDVYVPVEVYVPENVEVPEDLEVPLSPSEISIWIDPIDATKQYIDGNEEVLQLGRLSPSGLHCALVLIGVYLRSTGEPVMGVINQPFHYKNPETGLWLGKHFWGVSCGSVKACSISRPEAGPDGLGRETGILSVILSPGEKQVVKEALAPLCGGLDNIMYDSGAGHKMLCVLQGLADVYVFSKGSTFKWDLCAPHALLLALGGGVMDLCECLRQSTDGEVIQADITYHEPNSESEGAEIWANQGGLVAYLDPASLHIVIAGLKGHL